jgi:iron complex transport system ATP-binding protein
MENERTKILFFDSLEIGYTSGKLRRILLPPIRGNGLEGELIAVIGKNGIGKSTLLRTIAGLQPVLTGKMAIDNKNIGEYSRIQLSAKIGYISTETVKVSNMRVYDLVSLGRFPHTNWLGKIDDSDQSVIVGAIAKTGLSGFRDRHITELSDGERQRAMIAMVLAQDAKIMVMDEPTAFLDISSKYEIMHLLYELTRDRKKTIVFSTHDFNTAVNQSDKIWLIREEGLLEGAPEDIMLQGAFKSLFDETKVRYNQHDGSFTVNNIDKGSIKVSGKGEIRYWTEKAVVRAGYSLANSESAVEIEVPSKMNQNWKYRNLNDQYEFGSIYDLLSWIRISEPIF